MKKALFLSTIIFLLVLVSCSRKTPQFVHSIPDDAIAVLSMHPMQLHTKGQVNTLSFIREKIKDEFLEQVLDDPLSTGLMMDEYLYAFLRMEEEAPVIGVVCGMKDAKKFENTLSKINEVIPENFREGTDYTYIQPDDMGIISWNSKQMIFLASPDENEFSTEFFTAKLDQMYASVREEALTSMVDFKDFMTNMKDMNIWLSSDKLFDIVKEMGGDDIPEIPLTLYNNYAHVYMAFDKGVMNITGETHFSEEVRKNVEEFLVMKPDLNQDMLELAPGDRLLMALAGSLDLEKTSEMVNKFAPPELDSASTKVEMFTGMKISELISSLTGDFTLAVNAVDGEAIPIEAFIGLGVNGEMLQEKLMETAGSVAPIEEEGDFFIINFQGNQIYSGILNDILVITNVRDYKEKVKSGSYAKNLGSSAFEEFAGQSMGMYLNLNLEDYPGLVQGMLNQNEIQKNWVEKLTGPFDYLGFSTGNYENHIKLKTQESSENSLYTILKMFETAGE